MNIPVCKPYLWKNEIKYVNQAFQEGWISSKGRFLDEFENKFASYCHSNYAVSISNGTNALHLAFDILGLQEGDEVIVPDFTMMAPIFAILQRKCIPIPVDADETWNIDSNQITKCLSDKTKAILAVHTYGHPADVVSIKEICTREKLLLIEDCAEAIGAEVGGRMVGNWGDISCYSFYANKIITTGEGGMITTNNQDLFKLAKSKKNMSFGLTAKSRFDHSTVGYNYRMTNIQAAIGLAQLENINSAINMKIHIARVYRRYLKGITGLVMPPNTPWAKNVYWVFGILVTKEFGCSRDSLQSELSSLGIETRRFFTPTHKQPFLKKIGICGNFPNSSFLHKNGLYLPSFVELSDSDIKYICITIQSIQSKCQRKSN